MCVSVVADKQPGQAQRPGRSRGAGRGALSSPAPPLSRANPSPVTKPPARTHASPLGRSWGGFALLGRSPRTPGGSRRAEPCATGARGGRDPGPPASAWRPAQSWPLPTTRVSRLQLPARGPPGGPPGAGGRLQRGLRLPAGTLPPRVRLRRPHVLLALPRGVPCGGGSARPGRPEGEGSGCPRPVRAPRTRRGAPGPPSCNRRCCSGSQVYRDCSCVPQNLSSGFGHATAGKCTSTCQRKPLLLAFIFVVIIFTFLSSIPALTATLR